MHQGVCHMWRPWWAKLCLVGGRQILRVYAISASGAVLALPLTYENIHALARPPLFSLVRVYPNHQHSEAIVREPLITLPLQKNLEHYSKSSSVGHRSMAASRSLSATRQNEHMQHRVRSDGAGYERPRRVNARGLLSAGVRVLRTLPAMSRGCVGIPVVMFG